MKPGKLMILGARGSYPVALPDFSRYGGNTTSLALRTETSVIVFDAGTGLPPFGAWLSKDRSAPRNIELFFTHFHLDHVSGLVPFAPLYDEKFRIRIHLTAPAMESGRRALRELFRAPLWPVPWDDLAATISFHELPPQFELDQFSISHCELVHPGGSTGYRIEGPRRSAVLAFDHEPPGGAGDKPVIDFCEGADVLLIDSHFAPAEYEDFRGWGHGTWESAVDIGRAAAVDKIVMMHHHPEHTDNRIDELVEAARQKRPEIDAARPGMSFQLENREI